MPWGELASAGPCAAVAAAAGGTGGGVQLSTLMVSCVILARRSRVQTICLEGRRGIGLIVECGEKAALGKVYPDERPT